MTEKNKLKFTFSPCSMQKEKKTDGCLLYGHLVFIALGRCWVPLLSISPLGAANPAEPPHGKCFTIAFLLSRTSVTDFLSHNQLTLLPPFTKVDPLENLISQPRAQSATPR